RRLRVRASLPAGERAVRRTRAGARAGATRARGRLRPSRCRRGGRGMNGRVPALEVEGLVKHFPVGSRFFGGGAVVHAVEDVSFSLAPGEMLGLVGEAGTGKSTEANCGVRLLEPTGGTVRLRGLDTPHLP